MEGVRNAAHDPGPVLLWPQLARASVKISALPRPLAAAPRRPGPPRSLRPRRQPRQSPRGSRELRTEAAPGSPLPSRHRPTAASSRSWGPGPLTAPARRRPRSLAPRPSRRRKCRPSRPPAPRGRSRILAEWPSMLTGPAEKSNFSFLPVVLFFSPTPGRRPVAPRTTRPLRWRSHPQGRRAAACVSRLLKRNTSLSHPETSFFYKYCLIII